jgi:hypothetical protein
MDKLHLSQQAEESVRKLIASKDAEKVGYIAAIDPETGEAFYGKTVGEAAKEGRRAKGNPQAVFFFIRVGYPSVHVLKRMTLQGLVPGRCRLSGVGFLRCVIIRRLHEVLIKGVGESGSRLRVERSGERHGMTGEQGDHHPDPASLK